MSAALSYPFVVAAVLIAPAGEISFPDGVMWLHAFGDAVVATASLWMSVTILKAARARPELISPLGPMLFASLLLACGITHAVNAVMWWLPLPAVSGGLKVIAAAIAALAAVMLHRNLPRVLARPDTKVLLQAKDELEQHVRQRTSDLSATNERLAREVKQREQAEAEVRRLNRTLEERLNELQTVLDLLPVGIGIAQDPECREIRTNRLYADMLGISRQVNASLSAPPIPRTPFTVRQNGRELATDELPMQRAARENTPITNFEETIVREDGREVHVVINAVPLRDADGRARGCVATVQDITAHKMAAEDSIQFERRLQEMQKLESLGVLAGGIAHDFNNLLTGILGNASIARLELPAGHAPVRGALDNLEQAALRAADLCKQMLAYAGKGRFVVQPLSLSGLVRDTAELLEVSVHKRATLHFDLAEGLPAFQGDATQIRQVLMNLVINAAEAMGERKGAITIHTTSAFLSAERLAHLVVREAAAEGVFVCLEVSDTGSGMDPQMIARIFDPFFTTKFTGRGLGLAAVMGIVRGHRGAIEVESAPGKGSTFRLFLPALEQRATPPDPILHAGSTAARGSASILVVDDEPAVRGVAVRVLRNAGYRVVEASDGATAVETVRRAPNDFDLVLLDLTMPRMDGEEAFRLMREVQPALRVVVMSGFNEQDTENRFFGRGLAGFVAKPFGAEALMAKVTSVLQRAAPKDREGAA